MNINYYFSFDIFPLPLTGEIKCQLSINQMTEISVVVLAVDIPKMRLAVAQNIQN